jgi:hypothetical protein
VIILAVVFFWRYIFTNDVMIPWDTATTFYSFQYFTADSLRKSVFPLWNPFNYAGEPWYGVTEVGLFYPFNLLMVILGALQGGLSYRLLELLLILHVALAGIGTYILLRSWSVSEFGALVSAMVFMFGGFMVSSIGFYDWILGAAWLPILLLFSQHALDPTNDWKPVVLTAIILALILLSGYAPMALVAGTVVLTSLIDSLLSSREPRRKTLRRVCSRFALLLIVIFGLSAVALIPIAMFIRSSVYTRPVTVEYLQIAGTDISQLVTLVLPDFFGSLQGPAGYWGPGQLAFAQNYYGVFTLLLIVVSLRRIHDRRFICALLLGFLGVLAAYPTPTGVPELIFQVLAWFGLAPVFRPSVFRALTALSIAFLAGIGADLLARDRESLTSYPDSKASTFALAIGFAAALFLQVVSIVLMLHIFPMGEAAAERINEISNALIMASLLFLVSSCVLLPRLGWVCRRRSARETRIACTSVKTRRLSVRTFKAMLLLILFVDLYTFGSAVGFNAISANPNTFVTENQEPGVVETDLIRFLKQDRGLFRVDFNILGNPSMQRQFEAYAMIHKIQIIGGTGSAYLLRNYLACRLQFSSLFPYGFSVRDYNSAFLNLFNVKYVVIDKPLEQVDPSADLSTYELVYARYYMVYENKRTLARAFVAPLIRALQNRSAIPTEMASASMDPTQTILVARDELAGDSQLQELLLRKEPPQGFQAVARVTTYEPNEIMIQTSSTHDAVLFLGEIYYEGWEAYVDGIRTSVHEADLCFRAVALPSGNHDVVFKFEPLSLYVGIVTSVTVLAVAMCLLYPRGAASVARLARQLVQARPIHGARRLHRCDQMQHKPKVSDEFT